MDFYNDAQTKQNSSQQDKLEGGESEGLQGSDRKLIHQEAEESEEEEELLECDLDLVSESETEDEDNTIARKVMLNVRAEEQTLQEEQACITQQEKLKEISKVVPRNVCLFILSHFFSYLIGLGYVIFAYFVARALNQALYS